MALGDGNEQERKTSRCLDSRGGGDRVSVSPFFELDGLGVSEGCRVQFLSAAGTGEVCGGDLLREPAALSISLTATGKRRFSFDVSSAS